MKRDHPMRIDQDKINAAVSQIFQSITDMENAKNRSELTGIEGIIITGL